MRKWPAVACVLVLVAGVWAAETGTLKVATQGMVVTIKIPKGEGKKPLEVPVPAGKDASLPAGTYGVARVQLYKPDARGQMWCLNAISDLGKLSNLEVAQGATTTVETGEPLKISTRLVVTAEKPARVIRGTAPAGPPPPPIKTVTVYLDYVGQAGEHYGPKVMVGANPAQTKPIIRIKDENDRVLSEGEYHYGSSGYGGFG
jgi:hypothetical protein